VGGCGVDTAKSVRPLRPSQGKLGVPVTLLANHYLATIKPVVILHYDVVSATPPPPHISTPGSRIASYAVHQSALMILPTVCRAALVK
jgi:hypothetical protein